MYGYRLAWSLPFMITASIGKVEVQSIPPGVWVTLTEPKRHNASHGLARWAAWSMEEHTENSVSLVYRLMAQTGYPWTVDLHVLYDLSADGLTVTQTATNLADTPAPHSRMCWSMR